MAGRDPSMAPLPPLNKRGTWICQECGRYNDDDIEECECQACGEYPQDKRDNTMRDETLMNMGRLLSNSDVNLSDETAVITCLLNARFEAAEVAEYVDAATELASTRRMARSMTRTFDAIFGGRQ